MSLINNKEVFSTVEFDAWADRKGLNEDEKYLIVKYWNKNGKTVEAGTGGGIILREVSCFQILHHYQFLKLCKGKRASQP